MIMGISPQALQTKLRHSRPEGMHRRRSLSLYTGCRNKRDAYSSCNHSKKRTAACYKRKPATKGKVTLMTEERLPYPGFE